MTKRLVKLRGTENFRRVDNKTKGPAPVKTHGSGPLWEACNPSPFEQAIQAVRFVRFSKYTNAKGNPAGAIAGAAVGATLGPYGAATGALVGSMFGSLKTTTTSGGAWQPTKAFRPVSFLKVKPPCPKKTPFTEQTFEQVQAQYKKNNIKIDGGNNIQPMESQ